MAGAPLPAEDAPGGAGTHHQPGGRQDLPRESAGEASPGGGEVIKGERDRGWGGTNRWGGGDVVKDNR